MSNILNRLSSENLINLNIFKSTYSNNTNIDFILNKYNEYIKESCNKRLIKNRIFVNKVNIPRFLQEFYYIFYLSLIIIKKYYRSNSYIISLGESPSKIVMAQSFFYKDTETYEKIKSEGSYPFDLTFQYFPISKLRVYTSREFGELNFISRLSEESIDNIIKGIDERLNDLSIDKYLKYFEKYSFDPKNIIQTDKNYIFLDRAETYSSILALLYIYSKMIIKQGLTPVQINKFLNQFKIVGFDGDYDTFINNRNENINIFIKKIFKNSSKKIFEFHTIKLYQNEIPSNINNTLHNLPKSKHIFSNYSIGDTIINFGSLPEMFHIGTRCVQSRKVLEFELENLEKINISKIKNTNPMDSKNCNLFNLVLSEINSFLSFNDNIFLSLGNIEQILSEQSPFKILSFNFSFASSLFNDKKVFFL
jgi:hypothetical protein